jgi:hypothetical protein
VGYNCGDFLLCTITSFSTKFLELFAHSAAAAALSLEALAAFLSQAATIAFAPAKTNKACVLSVMLYL